MSRARRRRRKKAFARVRRRTFAGSAAVGSTRSGSARLGAAPDASHAARPISGRLLCADGSLVSGCQGPGRSPARASERPSERASAIEIKRLQWRRRSRCRSRRKFVIGTKSDRSEALRVTQQNELRAQFNRTFSQPQTRPKLAPIEFRFSLGGRASERAIKLR